MYVCMYVFNRENVEAYVTKVAGKSDLERTATGKDRGKTGVPLVSNYYLVKIFSHLLIYTPIYKGSSAIHPLSGKSVPIWIADYVLSGYGTGAVHTYIHTYIHSSSSTQVIMYVCMYVCMYVR